MVLDGFGNGAVTVQDGSPAVDAGCGSVGGSSVDGGDEVRLIFMDAALLSDTR
jgi:hypothetical protein